MSSEIPESHRDLLEAPVATLATLGPDGRPQLSAVWFLADDEGIRISLTSTRQKTKNLQANPVATLFVLDPADPMRYLEVRGDVTLAVDADYAFADVLGQKYGGADLREMDAGTPDAQRVVVTLHPARVNAVAMG